MELGHRLDMGSEGKEGVTETDQCSGLVTERQKLEEAQVRGRFSSTCYCGSRLLHAGGGRHILQDLNTHERGMRN